MTTVVPEQAHQGRAVPRESRDVLALWAAEGQNRHSKGDPCPGRLRFVFYGRVSTEDWQDPVTSRARQREQAEALVRGHGVIVAEFSTWGRAGRWRGPVARGPPRWSPSSLTRAGGGTRS